MKITLLGYMGSGKTTIGYKLAKELSLKFIDLDMLIEKKEEMSVSEFFKSRGEVKFRKTEREFLQQLLDDKESFVLAVGGGTPVYYDNIDLINQKSESFYLRPSTGELINRLRNEKLKRPLLAHLDDEFMAEYVGKHLFERRNFYEQAKFTIDTSGKNIEETVQNIIHQIHLKETHPNPGDPS